MSVASLYAVGLFLTACVIADLKTRRIPNLLTLTGMATGLVLSGLSHGASGLIASAGGILLAVGLLFLPFALGGIGGGDVKMMAAVGAFIGPRPLLASLVAGMILGGLVAVGVLWRRGRLGEKLHTVGAMMSSALLGRSLAPLRAPAPSASTITLPYSVPLGLGTALTLSCRYTWGA